MNFLARKKALALGGLKRNRRRRMTKAHARGRPQEEILRLARERRADLIVVGRGRRSALATFGSCARRVAEAAACPVLVVRGK